MFKPSSPTIEKIAQKRSNVITQLESLFPGKVNVYIDYANVRPWANKLNWHVDLKRLKRFLECFDNLKEVKYYYGILKGDDDSQKRIDEAKRLGYGVETAIFMILLTIYWTRGKKLFCLRLHG